MTVIRSSEYDDAVKAIQNSALFYHMVYKTKAVEGKRIIDLTRAEMVEHEVIHPRGGATFSFTQAANHQFQRLEEANPDYVVPGFRAIGTVSEAIIKTWESTRNTIKFHFQLTDDDIDNRLIAGENISEILNSEMDKRIARKEA